MGLKANEFLEASRESIASLINVKKEEIIFTSGATESNNLAILGILNSYKNNHKRSIHAYTTYHASYSSIFITCIFFVESEKFQLSNNTKIASKILAIFNFATIFFNKQSRLSYNIIFILSTHFFQSEIDV
jgi:hypothetical protein